MSTTLPYVVSNNAELILPIDNHRSFSDPKKGDSTIIKKQVPTKKEIREIIKASKKEPGEGNEKRNGLAVAGFIFSVLSLVLLLLHAPIFILTIVLASIFSILGLKSNKRDFAIVGLTIVGIMAVIALTIFILLIIYSNQK